jgi:hypothetical protein
MIVEEVPSVTSVILTVELRYITEMRLALLYSSGSIDAGCTPMIAS